MKKGDLVRVIKNDMSLVLKLDGIKDNLFFNKVGIILSKTNSRIFNWYTIMFDTGKYHARQDAIEIINES